MFENEGFRWHRAEAILFALAAMDPAHTPEYRARLGLRALWHAEASARTWAREKIGKRVVVNTCALVSYHGKEVSVHVGVYPEEDSLYMWGLDGCDEDCTDIRWWLWGLATEPYDRCIDYVGVGPFVRFAMHGGTFWRTQGCVLDFTERATTWLKSRFGRTG